MAKRKQSGGIGHGSEAHAALLGLRKATDDDKIQHEGWAFGDLTQFGFNFRDEAVLDVLRQRVSELTTQPPVPQDKNPNAPNYLQPMWTPELGAREMREQGG